MKRPKICDWTNRIGRAPCWADTKRPNYRLDTADFSSPFTFVQNLIPASKVYRNIRKPEVTFDIIDQDLTPLLDRCTELFSKMAEAGHESRMLLIDDEPFPPSAWDSNQPGYEVYLREHEGKVDDRLRRAWANRVEQRFRLAETNAIEEVAMHFWPRTQVYRYGATPIGYGTALRDKNGHPWPESSTENSCPVTYLRRPARIDIRDQAESHILGLRSLRASGKPVCPWVSVPCYLNDKPWTFDSATLWAWAATAMAAREAATEFLVLWGRSQDWTDLREDVARSVLLGGG
jgi:hypothetical protein